VRLRSGAEHTAVVAVPAGSRAAPFSEDTYWDKFGACLAYAGASPALEDLKPALLDLAKLPDIRALTRHLRLSFA
jgi:hypothetical protein